MYTKCYIIYKYVLHRIYHKTINFKFILFRNCNLNTSCVLMYIYPIKNFSYKNTYKYIYKNIYNYIQNMSIYDYTSFFFYKITV